MKLIWQYLRLLGKYRLQMAVFLVISTVAVALETIRPYWMKLILESAELKRIDRAIFFLGLFGVSTIGGNLVSALAYFFGDKVMAPFGREVRERVFQKVMELDFAYHVEKNTGSLISAFRRGDSAVFTIFMSIFHELYRVLIGLAVTLFFLIRASADLAVILCVLFVGNLFLIWWLITTNLKTRTEFNKAEDEVAGVIGDDMINYETVKFFSAEKKERGRLSNKFETWMAKFWGYANSFRLMDICIGTTSGIGMLLIIWLALKKLGNSFSIGDLVMVSGFITGFYYQFFNLFFRIREIAKSMTDLEKYFGILDQEIKVKDPIKYHSIPKESAKIVFKNIGFLYPKNQDKILDGINLTINPGEKVALVGRSGAGKTTLVKLLLRFYDPSEGIISIGGVNIKKIRKSDLRSLMGVVPQEPIMFNNTVKFNLAYGKENAGMEEIKTAAEKANILDFIESLPEKWETQVGERGIKLSGGQKQRLAIARALLADPEILIFDEATSNLDSESEKKIQGALEEAGKNRTVIIIAHRFSTIRDVDKIVVLSNGMVAETGKHDELINLNGIYSHLWTLQAKGKLKTEEGLLTEKVE